MLSKIQSIFKPYSPAIAAAKALPIAYREMLGLDFMVCENRDDFDWSGLGSPIALAEVKSTDSNTGKFDFYFVILPDNDQDPFSRFKSEMVVKQSGDAFLFTVKRDRVEIVGPVTSEKLRPVLEMALKNRDHVGLYD
jgi:hypothetical protein